MTETQTNPDQEFRVFRYLAWVGSESFNAWEVHTVALFRSWLADYGVACGAEPAEGGGYTHGQERGKGTVVRSAMDTYGIVDRYCATCERWYQCEGADGLRKWTAAHDYPHDALPLEVAPNGY